MVVIPSDRRHVGRGFDSHQVHQLVNYEGEGPVPISTLSATYLAVGIRV